MKIVRIYCGLGNQMFQYAFYLSLRTHYGPEETRGDVSFGNEASLDVELLRVFEPPLKLVSETCLDRLYDRERTLPARVRRKLMGCRPNIETYSERQIDRLEWSYSYKPEVFQKKGNIYFDGFWQSELYFSGIKDEVRKNFTFKNIDDDRTTTFLRDEDGKRTVSIHVRRGDYLNHPTLKWIADSSYYKDAICYIRAQLGGCRFLVFSDDIPWCRMNLPLASGEAIFVDWNEGTNSYKDMYLMSRCQHNIVCNSSFSWWGAWLNRNPGKLVVAPRKWVDFGACGHPEITDTDIVPREWVRI
jgi:hypothetical protein